MSHDEKDIDFSIVPAFIRGKQFTLRSIGLAIDGTYDDPAEFDRPAQLGTIFEILLLYTVDRKPGARVGEPPRYLTEQEKRERFALALRTRGCARCLLTSKEVQLLRTAANVLSIEPYGVLMEILDNQTLMPDT